MSYLAGHWPIRAGGRGWLLAAVACALALALLALADAQISSLGRALPEPVTTVFAWITRLGESDWILIPSLAVLVIGVAGMLLLRSYTPSRALAELSRIGGFIFVGVGAPSLLTTIVKRFVGRGRPELDGGGPFDFQGLSWVDWMYQSFPSGHATTGFALCFTVAFLLPRAFGAMLALAALIGLSRIVLGAHFPTDVLGGALVGTLGAYAVRNVFAARRWVFEYDGTVVVRRPAAGLKRLLIRLGWWRRRP